jgi:hypothetical protein
MEIVDWAVGLRLWWIRAGRWVELRGKTRGTGAWIVETIHWVLVKLGGFKGAREKDVLREKRETLASRVAWVQRVYARLKWYRMKNQVDWLKASRSLDVGHAKLCTQEQSNATVGLTRSHFRLSLIFCRRYLCSLWYMVSNYTTFNVVSLLS